MEEIKTTRGFSLWPLAHAAEPVRRWSVPSAKTLAAYKDQMQGVGYTVVQIETDALRDAAIIGVEVDVRVNGVPVLEDGLAAALRPVPHDPTKPFRHRYALESLDFEGAQAGCEAIVLTLRPRLASGKTGEPLSATLPYVALRDAPGKQVPFGKGTLSLVGQVRGARGGMEPRGLHHLGQLHRGRRRQRRGRSARACRGAEAATSTGWA